MTDTIEQLRAIGPMADDEIVGIELCVRTGHGTIAWEAAARALIARVRLEQAELAQSEGIRKTQADLLAERDRELARVTEERNALRDAHEHCESDFNGVNEALMKARSERDRVTKERDEARAHNRTLARERDVAREQAAQEIADLKFALGHGARTIARMRSALRGAAQRVDENVGFCWCSLPSMIPYRGHEGSCEEARAALKETE